jgi:hypothetical protein
MVEDDDELARLRGCVFDMVAVPLEDCRSSLGTGDVLDREGLAWDVRRAVVCGRATAGRSRGGSFLCCSRRDADAGSSLCRVSLRRLLTGRLPARCCRCADCSLPD